MRSGLEGGISYLGDLYRWGFIPGWQDFREVVGLIRDRQPGAAPDEVLVKRLVRGLTPYWTGSDWANAEIRQPLFQRPSQPFRFSPNNLLESCFQDIRTLRASRSLGEWVEGNISLVLGCSAARAILEHRKAPLEVRATISQFEELTADAMGFLMLFLMQTGDGTSDIHGLFRGREYITLGAHDEAMKARLAEERVVLPDALTFEALREGPLPLHWLALPPALMRPIAACAGSPMEPVLNLPYPVDSGLPGQVLEANENEVGASKPDASASSPCQLISTGSVPAHMRALVERVLLAPNTADSWSWLSDRLATMGSGPEAEIATEMAALVSNINDVVEED
ncbi:MAG: hypothetical protein M3P51_12510 [Chloroflexota bacterium]|nr:hypothetical protein [Chloroflexota bacterium]